MKLDRRQVKEKFGSLHFVVFAVEGLSEINERISELVLAASNRSLQICEYCGKSGEFVTDGCIATLCPDHARQATENPAFPPAAKYEKSDITEVTHKP